MRAAIGLHGDAEDGDEADDGLGLALVLVTPVAVRVPRACGDGVDARAVALHERALDDVLAWELRLRKLRQDAVDDLVDELRDATVVVARLGGKDASAHLPHDVGRLIAREEAEGALR